MIFTTEYKTINKKGKVETYVGSQIQADTWEIAEIAAEKFNLTIVGELIDTIDFDINDYLDRN